MILKNHHITANDEYLDYIYGEPALAKHISTIFLIHGFQDISFGWRNQIPILIEEGFRTVAIDCIGYGGTVCELLHYLVIGWCWWCGVNVVTVFHRFGLSTAYQGQFQLTDCYRRPPQYHPNQFRTTPSSGVQTMLRSWQAPRVILGGHDWCVCSVHFIFVKASCVTVHPTRSLSKGFRDNVTVAVCCKQLISYTCYTGAV